MAAGCLTLGQSCCSLSLPTHPRHTQPRVATLWPPQGLTEEEASERYERVDVYTKTFRPLKEGLAAARRRAGAGAGDQASVAPGGKDASLERRRRAGRGGAWRRGVRGGARVCEGAGGRLQRQGAGHPHGGGRRARGHTGERVQLLLPAHLLGKTLLLGGSQNEAMRLGGAYFLPALRRPVAPHARKHGCSVLLVQPI